MDERIRTDARVATLLIAALNGTLTEQQAQQLAAIDDGLARLARLAAAGRIAEMNGQIAQQNARIAELEDRLGDPAKVDPATPSGQRPIYTRPAAPKRKDKPGARRGHVGTRRGVPERIDE